MNNIKLYEINSGYIDYLAPLAPHLFHNKKQSQQNERKYIGVVFFINGFNYFAPLSSFKDKHINMKNSIDFLKIKNYAVINLNNMFPVPSALLFIAFGLLFGCIMSDKAVGGISSILVNAAAWLSGIWFDLELVGGVFKKIAYCLPFVHCVDAAKLALSGSCAGIGVHLAWIFGYAAVIFIAAVLCFSRKMKSL